MQTLHFISSVSCISYMAYTNVINVLFIVSFHIMINNLTSQTH